MDRLSKPEKQSTKDMDFCHKASVLYRDWQAYHDQEMQRVVDEKESVNQYLYNECSGLTNKVKQLEEQIKEMKDNG